MNESMPAGAPRIVLEPIDPKHAMLFKDVRLRALKDTPSAFSSTYAKESRFTDADWVARALQWTNELSAAYLAIDADTAIPCGIAGGFVDGDDPSRAYLVSVWVAPTYRRTGVGRALVDAVILWAAARRVSSLSLIVTSNNDAAIGFYRNLGFRMTGHSKPYVNDPTLLDLEMARAIC
jgi:ribosomal protein S18 acetylase RimI-like enzyme